MPAAPTVLAADGGADRALELGLEIDVVIGDLDSIGPETLARLERDGVRVLGHPAAKDATDLELALDEAVALGARRVLVVASAAGRLDHLLSSLLLLGLERYASLELTALVGDAVAWVVRGERRLAGSPGALLSLFALGGPARIRTDGLEYPLVDELVDAGSSRGVSNVFLGDDRDGPRHRGRRPRAPPRRSVLTRSGRIRGLCLALALGAVAVLAAGCGGEDEAAPTEVVLVTHDSFAISKEVRQRFERESGLRLRILQAGDANETLNRALLTAGDPQGDVIFGIDDSVLSRAIEGDLLEDYRPDALATVEGTFLPQTDLVTPIDHGEVCLNVDRGWFAERGLAPPERLEDLTDPRYRNLLVVENPATSSPGLAFLLATVARFGEDGWQDYWRALRANGVLAVDGWEEAYTQQFSGASGSPGKRPIVVSYATSPAAEVIFAAKPPAEAPTAAVEDGCYRQVEYAGILRGARNEDGARTLLEFMLSEAFQADVPGSMFVYPVREGVELPPAFVEHALVPDDPLGLPADEIDENRDRWVDEWTEIVVR